MQSDVCRFRGLAGQRLSGVWTSLAMTRETHEILKNPVRKY